MVLCLKDGDPSECPVRGFGIIRVMDVWNDVEPPPTKGVEVYGVVDAFALDESAQGLGWGRDMVRSLIECGREMEVRLFYFSAHCTSSPDCRTDALVVQTCA